MRVMVLLAAWFFEGLRGERHDAMIQKLELAFGRFRSSRCGSKVKCRSYRSSRRLLLISSLTKAAIVNGFPAITCSVKRSTILEDTARCIANAGKIYVSVAQQNSYIQK